MLLPWYAHLNSISLDLVSTDAATLLLVAQLREHTLQLFLVDALVIKDVEYVVRQSLESQSLNQKLLERVVVKGNFAIKAYQCNRTALVNHLTEKFPGLLVCLVDNEALLLRLLGQSEDHCVADDHWECMAKAEGHG